MQQQIWNEYFLRSAKFLIEKSMEEIKTLTPEEIERENRERWKQIIINWNIPSTRNSRVATQWNFESKIINKIEMFIDGVMEELELAVTEKNEC